MCLFFPPSKKFGLLRVLSRISVEKFLPHKTKSFRRVTSMCCVSEKFWYREKLLDKSEGEVSKFSFEIFLSRSADKFRRGTPYRVTGFGYRKVSCLRPLCHDFLSIFLSRSTKKFCSGTLLYCVLGMFPVAIKFMDKNGGVSKFSCENFFSHSAEKFPRVTF